MPTGKENNPNKSIKKILIVDDDPTLIAILKNFLEKHGYQTTDANDGQRALELFQGPKFDLILSDIFMPRITGLELLKRIRASSDIPVILMTGFLELNETIEAGHLGVNGFLPKPFKTTELLGIIERAVTGLPKGEALGDTFAYCKINISDFSSGRAIHTDIYLRFPNGTYIKVAHHGDDLSELKINNYKQSNINFLYLRLEDFLNYIGLDSSKSKLTLTDAELLKRGRLLEETKELIKSDVKFDKVPQEEIDEASTFIENAIIFLSREGKVLEILDALSQHTEGLYLHGVAVGILSVILAKKMGWVSISQFFNLAAGGLLHDIGKLEINPEILRKSTELLKGAENSEFELHPKKGFETLKRLGSVSRELLDIVSQHHEMCDGEGYPLALRRAQIQPLARVLAVASEYCRQYLKGSQNSGKTSTELVDHLKSNYSKKFDREVLNVIVELLG